MSASATRSQLELVSAQEWTGTPSRQLYRRGRTWASPICKSWQAWSTVGQGGLCKFEVCCPHGAMSKFASGSEGFGATTRTTVGTMRWLFTESISGSVAVLAVDVGRAAITVDICVAVIVVEATIVSVDVGAAVILVEGGAAVTTVDIIVNIVDVGGAVILIDVGGADIIVDVAAVLVDVGGAVILVDVGRAAIIVDVGAVDMIVVVAVVIVFAGAAVILVAAGVAAISIIDVAVVIVDAG